MATGTLEYVEESSFIRDVKAGLAAVAAMGQAIKELGTVPSGHLFEQVQPYMGLNAYLSVINTLKAAGLVKETHNLLTWIGG